MDGDIDSELDIQSDSDGEILLVGDAVIEISEEEDDDEDGAVEMLDDDSEYDINNDEDDDSDNTSDVAHDSDGATRNSGRDTERPHIDDDEDDVIKAIVANTKTERTHPPDINIDDFVVDLSFHPERDLLAVGTMSGDCLIYKYSVQENALMNTLELHNKAIRDIEFSLDGRSLLSASKDRSILISDFETGKYTRLYENAHEQPVSTMSVFSEHLFVSGDDDGTVKLWDTRDNSTNPVLSLKEVDDYITCILTNDAKRVILATSGDGFLTALNIAARKLETQSEPYDEELTCMGLFRNDSKLVVGTSKGRLYSFNWNEFGYHSNMYPGPKTPMSIMVPVTDRVAVVAGEEGVIRAMHCVPGRNLGVVGQHSLAIDAMDINHDGEYIVSTSDSNEIKFWNIKYFEELDEIKYNEKQNKSKEQKHNLPSSKVSNAGDFFADLA